MVSSCSEFCLAYEIVYTIGNILASLKCQAYQKILYTPKKTVIQRTPVHRVFTEIMKNVDKFLCKRSLDSTLHKIGAVELTKRKMDQLYVL